MKGLRGSAVLVGVVVLVGAVGLLGASVYRAVAVDATETGAVTPPLPDEVAEALAHSIEAQRSGETADPTEASRRSLGDLPAGGLAEPRAPTTPREVLELAVQNDLFLPERTAPSDRYVLPSERPPPVEEEDDDDRPRFPDLRVHGTMQVGDVGMAVVQLYDRDEDDRLPPRVLALGESIGGYYLMSVDDETATLTGPGGSRDLPVRPLPRAEPPRESRNSDRNERNAREATTAQLERMLQQLGGRGNIRFNTGNGNVTVRDGVIIRDLPAGRGGRGGRGGGGEQVEVPVENLAAYWGLTRGKIGGGTPELGAGYEALHLDLHEAAAPGSRRQRVAAFGGGG